MKNKFLSITLIAILTMVIIAFLSVPYWPSLPEWTGFQDKKLWDLIEILIIPIVLAISALLFSQYQRNTEIQIETEKQIVAAFQSYIDRIKDLILDLYSIETKRGEITDEISEKINELGNIGAAYTQATLQQLDGKRKGMLLEFLYNTHLIGWVELPSGEQYPPLIYLGESADFKGLVLNLPALRGVILSFTNLSNSNFIGLDFYKAHFVGCNFTNSKFTGVNFCGADLGGANFQNVKWGNGNYLGHADLRHVNLKNADMRKAILDDVNLEIAIYNRYTKLPKGFDPVKARMVFEK